MSGEVVTPSNRDSRTRGVMVHPMPLDVTGPFDRYALLIRADGATRMVHSEGVTYLVTDEKPWTWNDFDPTCPAYVPAHLRDLACTIKPVDLADWVHSFGARLEANFSLAYSWAVSS